MLQRTQSMFGLRGRRLSGVSEVWSSASVLHDESSVYGRGGGVCAQRVELRDAQLSVFVGWCFRRSKRECS